MAVKAEPMKKTVPTKAAEVKASSMAPELAAWPTSHGMAKPGSTQRSSRSWMTSSSSTDRCTSPRQKARAPSQAGPCRLSAATGCPTARSPRTTGSSSQAKPPAARARSGSPSASAAGERQRLRRPQAMPAPASTPNSSGPIHGNWPVAACSAAYTTASQLPSASAWAAGSRTLAGHGERIRILPARQYLSG